MRRHGRDGKLCVWDMSRADQEWDKTLPVEQTSSHRREPWLLHSLPTSMLTFCSFATCKDSNNASDSGIMDRLLVTLPGETDSTIIIYQLPTEKHIGLIPAPPTSAGKTGMVMAMKISHLAGGHLIVIAGYESGRTCMFRQEGITGKWEIIYNNRPHEQPLLSLDVAPSLDYYLTSGADAIVAKHPVAAHGGATEPLKTVQTKHAGQQGLCIRSDGKIFATSGWDGRARIYSCKSMKELAVLKWHREGCYSIAFANIDPANNDEGSDREDGQEIVTTTGSQITPAFTQARNTKTQNTHWVVVGSKDRKISLWEIF